MSNGDILSKPQDKTENRNGRKKGVLANSKTVSYSKQRGEEYKHGIMG